jgi:hypothetical protein
MPTLPPLALPSAVTSPTDTKTVSSPNPSPVTIDSTEVRGRCQRCNQRWSGDSTLVYCYVCWQDTTVNAREDVIAQKKAFDEMVSVHVIADLRTQVPRLPHDYASLHLTSATTAPAKSVVRTDRVLNSLYNRRNAFPPITTVPTSTSSSSSSSSSLLVPLGDQHVVAALASWSQHTERTRLWSSILGGHAVGIVRWLDYSDARDKRDDARTDWSLLHTNIPNERTQLERKRVAHNLSRTLQDIVILQPTCIAASHQFWLRLYRRCMAVLPDTLANAIRTLPPPLAPSSISTAPSSSPTSATAIAAAATATATASTSVLLSKTVLLSQGIPSEPIPAPPLLWFPAPIVTDTSVDRIDNSSSSSPTSSITRGDWERGVEAHWQQWCHGRLGNRLSYVTTFGAIPSYAVRRFLRTSLYVPSNGTIRLTDEYSTAEVAGVCINTATPISDDTPLGWTGLKPALNWPLSILTDIDHQVSYLAPPARLPLRSSFTDAVDWMMQCSNRGTHESVLFNVNNQ